MMLLEEGFEVVSVDASDKMLKQAYKQRWDHRKEDIYDKWGKKKIICTELKKNQGSWNSRFG